MKNLTTDKINQIVSNTMSEFFKDKDKEFITRHEFDKNRFPKVLEYIRDLQIKEYSTVLEIGGGSLASLIIQKAFPNYKYTLTDFELRKTFPYSDNMFDFIINMEVIEHIFDIELNNHATTFSGVKHILKECIRVLKPNGFMFLTTPNANSVWIIQRALLYEPPMLFDNHFREFTIEELRKMLTEAGFSIIKLTTEKVWHFWNFEPIYEFMKKNNYSLKNRGDDIFCIVQKKKLGKIC